MSTGAVIAIVFVIIFVIGVTVGIISVIALSAVRTERRVAGRGRGRLSDPDVLDEPDDDAANTGAVGVPGHWDGVRGDEHPRWPGDTDNEYSG